MRQASFDFLPFSAFFLPYLFFLSPEQQLWFPGLSLPRGGAAGVVQACELGEKSTVKL